MIFSIYVGFDVEIILMNIVLWLASYMVNIIIVLRDPSTTTAIEPCLKRSRQNVFDSA